jgi:phosphoglycolate phosphatase
MPVPIHVIFDLDGTLIDSAPVIVASYRTAFAACGITPARTVDESIIGAPLAETLRLLIGRDDAELGARLARAFKDCHDTAALRQTAAYPGVDELLARLVAGGHTLHIATNKRLHPTRLILDLLGWNGRFASVHALDMVSPRLPDKATMLGHLLAGQGIARGAAVYVGDRAEDGAAAAANRLPFIAAAWGGYGGLGAAASEAPWPTASTPLDLIPLLNAQ